MAITVRTLASERAMREVSSATRAQEASLRKVSSGQRVERAADGTAALATALNLAARQRAYEVAARNGHQAMGMLDLVDDGAASIADHLIRLRALTVKGSTDLVATDARTHLHEEARTLVASVDDVATTTRWGETSLLDAARTLRVKVSIDNDAAQDITVQLRDLSASGLGLASLDLRTRTTAEAGIATVDQALHTLNSARAEIGAFAGRVDHALSLVADMRMRYAEATSRLTDVDLGAEVASLVHHQVLASAGIAVALQARALPQDVLSLLRGSPSGSAARKPATAPRSTPTSRRIVPTGSTTPRATVARARATPASMTSGWRSLYTSEDDEAATTTDDTRTTLSATDRPPAPWVRVVVAEDAESGGFVALSVSLTEA